MIDVLKLKIDTSLALWCTRSHMKHQVHFFCQGQVVSEMNDSDLALDTLRPACGTQRTAQSFNPIKLHTRSFFVQDCHFKRLYYKQCK